MGGPRFGVSIGVTLSVVGESGIELMRRADAAMYQRTLARRLPRVPVG